MEDAIVLRHLHVERQVGLKPMLPIDLEAEELDVKLTGLGFVEDPQDRRDSSKFHVCAPSMQCTPLAPRDDVLSRSERSTLGRVTTVDQERRTRDKAARFAGQV